MPRGQRALAYRPAESFSSSLRHETSSLLDLNACVNRQGDQQTSACLMVSGKNSQRNFTVQNAGIRRQGFQKGTACCLLPAWITC